MKNLTKVKHKLGVKPGFFPLASENTRGIIPVLVVCQAANKLTLMG
jgi:hypothetical protein